MVMMIDLESQQSRKQSLLARRVEEADFARLCDKILEECEGSRHRIENLEGPLRRLFGIHRAGYALLSGNRPAQLRTVDSLVRCRQRLLPFAHQYRYPDARQIDETEFWKALGFESRRDFSENIGLDIVYFPATAFPDVLRAAWQILQDKARTIEFRDIFGEMLDAETNDQCLEIIEDLSDSREPVAADPAFAAAAPLGIVGVSPGHMVTRGVTSWPRLGQEAAFVEIQGIGVLLNRKESPISRALVQERLGVKT